MRHMRICYGQTTCCLLGTNSKHGDTPVRLFRWLALCGTALSCQVKFCGIPSFWPYFLFLLIWDHGVRPTRQQSVRPTRQPSKERKTHAAAKRA